MTTPTPNAAKPPFTLARELYGELFEAERLEIGMWHFAKMKPSVQRFILSHLLYQLLHGQAVANLNLRDIRERLAGLEQRLPEVDEVTDEVPSEEAGADGAEEDPEEDEADEGAAREEADRGHEDGATLEETVDDEDDEADGDEDEAEAGVHGADPRPGDYASLSPQLRAALLALDEAFTYEAVAETR